MSWRDIQVYYSQFARDDSGIAGLSSNNTVNADHPLEDLIDDSTNTEMRFDSAESDHWIEMDMGVGFAGFIDTLIIPEGHTLDGIACVLSSGASAAPATSRRSWTQSGTSVIKETASDSGTAWRYWRLSFNTSGAHVLPGLILTFKKTFTSGWNMPGADDTLEPSFIRFAQPSGIEPTKQTGVPRRHMILPFEHSLDTTDLATMDAWIALVGMHRPFWVDPPSMDGTPDTNDPVMPFKFDTPPRRQWGTAVPVRGIERKFFFLDVKESVD